MGYSEWPVVSGGGGGVSSVAMSVPSALLTVAGSPITTSGTLVVTLPTRAANIVFAGPVSGGAATPAFRSLVAADIPSLPYTTSTLASARIFVGNGSNIATAVAVTGDISVSNAGATAYAGTVPLNKGGTGQTTKAPAFDALSPMTTAGDIIIGGASGTGTRLGIGTDGQVLAISSGAIIWSTSGGGGITGPGSSTANGIVRWDGTGAASVLDSAILVDDTTSTNTRVHGVDNAVADANPANNLTLAASNKSAGTGVGGDLVIRSGSSAGGANGAVYVTSGAVSTAAGFSFSYTGTASGVVQRGITGAVGAPTYSFTSSTNSGFYLPFGGTPAVAAAGVDVVYFDANALQCNKNLMPSAADTLTFGAISTTHAPFKRGHIGTEGMSIGIGSGTEFQPNYHLDIRQATASTAVYSQYSITTTTGVTSADGTKVGLDASGNFVINQQEALAIKLFTSGTEAWNVDAAGILINKVAANESTGVGTPLLGTNSPAVTLTAPFTWLTLKTSDGSTVYLPVWK